ncbi:MAG TPA: C4-type zinc ribbon domain-containing protein [Pyrinomonadaceae bacterium]|nr:C4-type zinc ribbon domain-containing protein [Pyrinomonadaceae bacterium]
MKAELEQLIALQNADTGMRRLQAELESLPRRRAEIENEFDQRAFDFKALEQARDEARAARAQLDKELSEQRARASKAERDLMSSTNSKSYEAAIREADAAKKQASELETKILERMEAADAAEKSLSERSEEFSRIQSEREEHLRAFDEEARAKQAELESRRREREAIFERLPPAAKSTYKRISARIRDGVAMAEARNGSCSACFIALRPQVMAEVRRGEEIVTCDNCNRILYYQPASKTQSTTTVSAT